MRVLVGMQPVLTQVPPKSLRSIIATVLPAAVRRPARGGPAWPAPMIMASNFGMGVLFRLCLLSDAAFDLRAGLASERDDEEASAYSDAVLNQCSGEIPAESVCQEAAAFGPTEGSGDCADGSGDEPEKECAVREAESSSGESAHDDASDELWRDEAAGGGGALVVEDFAEGEEAHDPGGEGIAEKGKWSVGEVYPAEVSSPTHNGGSGEGAEPGDDPDQKGEYENEHSAP